MTISDTATEALLDVEDLVIRIGSGPAAFDVVRGVSFSVKPGETVCIVGESGSGKTLTALSIMGLHADPVSIASGRMTFEGQEIQNLPERKLARLRGNAVAMVFQDPMTSLNPVLTIGEQIIEVITAHRKGFSRSELKDQAEELLKRVGIPAARERLATYPHQLSGGMRQRILIAMALANHPRLIVADEPTTALDVTIQAQVMDVMRSVITQSEAALVLITHDMGLVAETADQVLVMYAGRIVEQGSVFDIFRNPRHPYTRALLESIPKIEGSSDQLLKALGGEPPRLNSLPTGCAFHPRCRLAGDRAICRQIDPPLREAEAGHASACHFMEELEDGSFPERDL